MPLDEPAVTVITPTIGRPTLARTVRSLQACLRQCPGMVLEHLVVVDGPELEPPVREVLATVADGGPAYRAAVLVLPYHTGRSAAVCRAVASTLARGAYVGFLDDDNWYGRDHLRLCLETMRERPHLQWMHTGRFMLRPGDGIDLGSERGGLVDRSESLGLLHATAFGGPDHHMVDTSCYFLTRRACQESAPFWHVDPIAESWGEDRLFFSRLAPRFPRCAFLVVPTVFYVTTEKGYDYVLRGNRLIGGEIEPYEGRLVELTWSPERYNLCAVPAAFPDGIVPLAGSQAHSNTTPSASPRRSASSA
jgi:glycosyltransferase involved in cell wall biosynthesis